METAKLKERAMIVELNISHWAGRKKDDNITREIETLHNSEDAGNFTKKLMVSKEHADIESLIGKARSYYRYKTLPWGESTRIIPNDQIFEFASKIGAMAIQHTNLVESFVKKYAILVEEQKNRLNGMFNPTDYPHPDIIRNKFSFRTTFSPLPEVDDFRCDLSDMMVENLKNQLIKETERRVKEANDDLLRRTSEVVNRMIETLAEPGKNFRDSLVGNIEEISKTLVKYNFNEDQHVTDVSKMLKSLCVDPDMLRNNDSFRQEILKKAKDVAKSI